MVDHAPLHRRMRYAAPAVVATLTGCGSPYSIFEPGGGQAGTLSQLGWFLVALMSVVTLVMGFLVLVGGLRRRGSLDEHAPIDEGGGKTWILVGGLGVPVTVLVGLFLLTVVTLGTVPRGGAAGEADLTIEITGHQWWWEVEYLDSVPSRRFSTANEIHIPVGRRVRVELRSLDVIHSFWVPRLHGKLDLIPGQANALVLEAEEPGVYRGECAEYCGVQHANMRFVVVAERPEAYEAWAAAQRQPAPRPDDPLLRRGHDAFMQNACALCHTIRGTRARGGVAPDLTHVGSRLTLAAGTLPNTTARMHAWIINAQSLKPGAKMPSLDQFDGETLRALASYLQSLE